MFMISGVAPDQLDGLCVGAIGEIEALEAVVGRGEADPGFGVARMQLDGLAEMPLGQAVTALAEVFLGDAQIVVGVRAQQLGLQRRRAAGPLGGERPSRW